MSNIHQLFLFCLNFCIILYALNSLISTILFWLANSNFPTDFSIAFFKNQFLAPFTSEKCQSRRETMLVGQLSHASNCLVSLTQTKSKGKELKNDVVNSIREAVDNYKFAYVLEFDNMRTNAFKELRSQLNDCRYNASNCNNQ